MPKVEVMEPKHHIKDWPDFDRTRHNYVLTTGCGDGCVSFFPIAQGIAWDIAAAMDNAPTDEQYKEMSHVDWRDWVNSLSVYDGDLEIATFNLLTWKWETL